MSKIRVNKKTVTPEDWGNNIFPEGMSSLHEVGQWLDDNCSNGYFSEWTHFGDSVYAECRRQLQDGEIIFR